MKRDWSIYLFLGVVFLIDQTARSTERIIADTGPKYVQMLELYSSEGCSSCPPADIWISRLTQDPGLWNSFVPVVFHVDYWNDLGWKDIFSSSEMSQRQRQVVSTWPQRTLYTPMFILNGKELKNWSNKKISDLNQKNHIELQIIEDKKNYFKTKIKGIAANKLKDYKVHAVLLGFGIEADITDGENSGRKLQHNFVVLDWAQSEIKKDTFSKGFEFNRRKIKAKKYAVAAWIEKVNTPVPLQAVGGYVD